MPVASPPRVLLVARGGPVDGAERQLLYLAQGLPALGVTPIVALDRASPLADALRAARVDVVQALRSE